MLFVSGIGTVTKDKISAVYKKQSWDCDNIKQLHRCLKDNAIVQNPIKDFGRMDAISKITVVSTALALYDASFSGVESNIGVIGTSRVGSLVSNMNFFTDYIESGRKMGRGNLFVYTLPTVSLSAVSIAFGFKGPLFFEIYNGDSFNKLLDCAEKTIQDQNCEGSVVVYAEDDKVTTFFITNSNEKSPDLMTIDELKTRNL